MSTGRLEHFEDVFLLVVRIVGGIPSLISEEVNGPPDGVQTVQIVEHGQCDEVPTARVWSLGHSLVRHLERLLPGDVRELTWK